MSCKITVPHWFFIRFFEWYCATRMIVWGANLLCPITTLDNPHYQHITNLGLTDLTLGISMIVMGCVWAAGLYINGRWKRSPLLRFAAAFAAAIIWGTIGTLLWLSDLKAGVNNTELAVYPHDAVFIIIACYRIAVDAGVPCQRCLNYLQE